MNRRLLTNLRPLTNNHLYIELARFALILRLRFVQIVCLYHDSTSFFLLFFPALRDLHYIVQHNLC
jgi:hypothetical protein